MARSLCLAIETSGRSTGAAVMDRAGALLAEELVWGRPPGEGQPLVPLIERVLALARAGAAELTLLACTIGPGSFTGLRVGLATLKGIALSRGLPIAGVSTLRALAASPPPEAWLHPGAPPFVAPAIDAKKGEIYGALFAGAEGEAVIGERAWAPPVFAEELRRARARHGAPEIVLVGDGAPIVLAQLAGVEGVRDLGDATRAIRPAAVARLAIAAAARGEAKPPGEVEPAYHRLSEAEVARAKRGA